jgi:hypothetical protein
VRPGGIATISDGKGASTSRCGSRQGITTGARLSAGTHRSFLQAWQRAEKPMTQASLLVLEWVSKARSALVCPGFLSIHLLKNDIGVQSWQYSSSSTNWW